MAPGASTGEHGRDFRPVWFEGLKNPRINGPILRISDVRTSLRFDSYRVRLGACWNYINSISQFHNRPNYGATSQYSVLFHSVLPNHHPVLLSPPVIPSKFSSDSASASPSGSDMLYYWNSHVIKHQVISQASKVSGAMCA
jgi:hypothetical protein